MNSPSEKRAICEKNLSGSQRPSRLGLGTLRLISVLLISFLALFFGAFAGDAQAHGMHPNSVSQPTALASSFDASDIFTSIANVADVDVKGCGLNCCSMAGCGFAPQRLEDVFLPTISVSMRQVFNVLPWVNNPLDSLQRPPRPFV